MNRKIYISVIFALLVGIMLPSCSEDDLSSKSIFDVTTEPKSVFDDWLDVNYLKPYNIDYKYRMEDIELTYGKNLTPASLKYSMQLAKIIKHVWLDAYAEVGGRDFVSGSAPSILHLVGSASWNNDGTITLGTAEGGLKITLYMINWLDPTSLENLNEYYLGTMHHEFTHILHQTKDYPQEFNLISAGNYLQSNWHTRDVNEYAPMGFVSAYAGSMALEDITEVTARYITYTDAEWDYIFANAGKEGREKIERKISIMKKYMMDEWNIDMDLLRRSVEKRMNEIQNLILIEDSWKSLYDPDLAEESDNNKSAIESAIRADWKASGVQAGMDKHPNCCYIHNANLMKRLNINE